MAQGIPQMRCAVIGIPTEYGAAIIDNTLSLLSTETTTEKLIDAWQGV